MLPVLQNLKQMCSQVNSSNNLSSVIDKLIRLLQPASSQPTTVTRSNGSVQKRDLNDDDFTIIDPVHNAIQNGKKDQQIAATPSIKTLTTSISSDSSSGSKGNILLDSLLIDNYMSPSKAAANGSSSSSAQQTVSSSTASSSSPQATSSSTVSSSSTGFSAAQIFQKFLGLPEYGELSSSGFYTPVYGGISYTQQTLAKAQVSVDALELTDLIQQYTNQAQNNIGKQLAQNEFYIQKGAVKSPCEIGVIGDIHGSIHSLVYILQDLVKQGYLDDQLKIKKSDFYLVFTGDYVDRGFYGSEVWYVLLKLKLANWDNVYLLRGNHEDYRTTGAYGFDQELLAKYKGTADQIKESLQQMYNYLPQAVFFKNADDWMAFCHGGLDTRYGIEELLDEKSPHIKICQADNTAITGFTWYDVLGNTFSEQRGANLPEVSLDVVTQLHMRALFRGHQHRGQGLKIGNTLHPGIQNGNVPIAISTVQPAIFTFTTATEGGLSAGLSSDVFYGIIKTDKDFAQWKLFPHLLARKQ